MKSLDISRSFMLIAAVFLWCGHETPVHAVVAPGSLPIANYEFVNQSSTGPAVQGFITFTNLDNMAQVYVQALLGPHQTEQSQVAVPVATTYIIGAKGFITTGAGVECGPLLQVPAPRGYWPSQYTVVVSYIYAADPSKFKCSVSLRQ